MSFSLSMKSTSPTVASGSISFTSQIMQSIQLHLESDVPNGQTETWAINQNGTQIAQVEGQITGTGNSQTVSADVTINCQPGDVIQLVPTTE